MPRSDYRSDYSPPRRRNRVAEYEDIDIRERRRGPRDRDYLRDAYDRRDERGGPLVIREEIDERRERDGRRGSEYREEEVIIAKSRREDRDRPRRRDPEREELRYRDRIVEEDDIKPRRRERPIEHEEIREELVYRPRRDRAVEEDSVRRRRRERPIEHEEIREELIYRPRRGDREPEPERYRDRDRDRDRDRQEYDQAWERVGVKQELIEVPGQRPIVAREVEEFVRRRPRVEEDESISIRRRDRERDRPRSEYREEIDFRERERRSPRGDYEEDIRIRERERGSPSGRRGEVVSITQRIRDGDEEIKITETRRNGGDEEISINERASDRPGDVRDEEVRITERDGAGSRVEEIDIRERDESRSNDSDHGSRRGDVKEEEIIIKRDGPDGTSEEIVISRKDRTPSPEPLPPPPPAEPEIIRPPPIHQEIITHHRHINYDPEPYRGPVSAPPKPRTPSPPPRPPSPPKSTFDEIAIRRVDEDGEVEEDIVIKRKEREVASRPPHSRQRSSSVDSRSTFHRGPTQIDEEADYYARRNAGRAFVGEAYHGATKDWAIVDVPPGTERVQMDGAGGASEEITWQRYNGVRRSKFIPESSRVPERSLESIPEPGSGRRRVVSSRPPKTDDMWTEVTKDLVVKEAIQSFGYDYEETEYFFYVMEFLNSDDVRRLVKASDEIRARRRERIRQIEHGRFGGRHSSGRSIMFGGPPPSHGTRIIEDDSFVVEWSDR